MLEIFGVIANNFGDMIINVHVAVHEALFVAELQSKDGKDFVSLLFIIIHVVITSKL